MKKIFFTCLVFLVTSCGGGGGSSSSEEGGGTTERETEKIRFINAIKSEDAVNVQLGPDVFIEEIAYGDASTYVESQEGTGDTAVPIRLFSPEKVIPILSASQDVVSGFKATILLLDVANIPELSVINETETAPLAGESKIRFINASEDVASVDVYMVLPGESISGARPALSSALAFKSVSPYVSVRAGAYDVVYTEAGSSNIVRRAQSITFDPQKNYSHMLIDRTGAERGQTSRIFEDQIFN